MARQIVLRQLTNSPKSRAQLAQALSRRDCDPDVAQAVLEVARETDAALIVVGVRHRSPVGKALMGSVGQRILLDGRR